MRTDELDHRRRRALAGAAMAFLAAWGPGAWRATEARADCSQTSVGLVPVTDLGIGIYQGFQGGLYPGGSSLRPAAHDEAADSLARVVLLDPNGVPNAAIGRIVLLTIGMSNTSQESSRFIPLANADPERNARVVLVNGAQGGWTASEVADPNLNGPYWTTVESRLTAAGVTPMQVQAVWLKEAEAQPTQPFPLDAQILQAGLEEIVRIVKSRYPRTRQIFVSSRIYAGYASTTLNPEPYAYQSGFAAKWMIQRQLEGSATLNFDPGRGPVLAPWLAWGPYTWADGLRPRGDGLIWECADFQDDGTHPSVAGADKVAAALLDFFKTDAVASRWFVDCAPADPGVTSPPPRVLDLDLCASDQAGGLELRWQSLGPAAGPATRYDVVAGLLGDLRESQGLAHAACAASSVTGSMIADPAADPPVGDGAYYLVRGRNACGIGSYGEQGALAGPRSDLDQASPCP